MDRNLKPILVFKDEREMEPFKSIVVPSSMRSPFWKYFGFPANENKEIITKMKVVCVICYSYIAYNKNTTNLSTHLNCKHPDVKAEIDAAKRKQDDVSLKDILTMSAAKKYKTKDDMTVNWFVDYDDDEDVEHRYKGFERKHPTGITDKSAIKSKAYKPKFQTVSISNENILVVKSEGESKTLEVDIEIEPIEHEQDDQFMESIDYNNIDINEEGNEMITEILETDSTANPHPSKDDYLSEEFLNINEPHEDLYQRKEIGRFSSKSSPKPFNKPNLRRDQVIELPSEVTHQVKQFLIQDLVPSHVIDGTGFKELLSFLSPNVLIPSSLEIEKTIDEEYHLQNSSAISEIKSIVNSRNFSLSFHKLGNGPMVEISVNYWSDSGSRIGSLVNQIFCISKNCTNFIQSFGDSLSNCSAFIIDFNLTDEFDDALPADIPIVPTFSFITKMAVEACMQLREVRQAVDATDEILMGKISKSHTWLQQFEILSQFLNESTNTGSNHIIQVLIECLQPLKNCLDVLAFETSNYASILKPVVLQLINQHYSDCDDATSDQGESSLTELEKDLKKTIYTIFQQNVAENMFLMMASFFDPRFQRLTSPEDLKLIRDDLEKSTIDDVVKSSIAKTSIKIKEKSSGLSSLFSNISTPTKTKPPKNRFDIEFRSYTEDVILDMELCPLEWWFENECLYPNLKQHVKKYFCVPSFVNNIHRLSLSDREELEKKYDNMGVDINEKLLWLHLNDLRRRSLDS